MLPKRSTTRATPVGGASPTNFKPRPGLPNSHVAKHSSSSCGSSKKRTRPSTVGSGGLLPRSFKKRCYSVVEARTHYYVVEDGETTRKIWDISGGAAVSNLGPGSVQRIKNVARAQEDKVSYVPGLSFSAPVAQEYAEELLKTTDGAMKGVVFYGSGSEAVEATYKLVLQRFKAIGQPQRRIFIAREQSYHGTTLAAISIGGHRARRQPFENVLTEAHHVSPCNPYRDMQIGETEREYVARLESQLRAKFEELGPENVAAFIVEPVVGAALGCMPSSPGYLQAMKKVCRDYGALFIVDEIMCGYGRCGTLHAWQRENVVPDIEVMGKGLAGGYKQISAMLISSDLYDELEECEFTFNHGHTFQNSPEGCAAGLECLKIIQEQDLVKNVEAMGNLLKQGLEARLGSHPNVLNIRGRGLFIGIEFGMDKKTKKSFNASDEVGQRIHELGLRAPHNIHVYPGFGCNGGTEGDHIIVSPPFNIDEKDVAAIIDKVGNLIDDFFACRP